ncbi:aldehyde dehydrogenase family protein [Rhodobacteraceae bacterium ASV31]|nr:aldehyde dehydrogenase family protein [Anianabacter salinae]
MAEADRAANAAADAFSAWSMLPPGARAAHLHAAAAALDSDRATLVDLASIEIGAAPSWTEFNIDLAMAVFRQAATLCDALGDEPAPGDPGSVLRRQPAGVVLGIAPWNAPITLAARAIAAPLACGNTVVMKGSEHCPLTHTRMIERINASGLPAGAANVVTNAHDQSEGVVERLIAHPAIRRINFTGSTRVGREVAVMAARHLKPCLLELSGKAPLVVLDDADLDRAVDAAVYGAFFNQGQICMSTERIIVVAGIADRFADALVARTAMLRAADPKTEAADLGTLIHAAAADRVRSMIEDAVRKGAVLRTGGEVDGAVMQPAVIDRVSSAMRLYHEESFGPVASILRVRDEDEALSVANSSDYGLSAAVFSADIARARRFADRLETGIVQINGPTVHDNPAMPFGGMKASGYGRFGGRHAIHEFTELRWIAIRDQAPIPQFPPR